jgi:hypothetical protein
LSFSFFFFTGTNTISHLENLFFKGNETKEQTTNKVGILQSFPYCVPKQMRTQTPFTLNNKH